MQCFISRYLHSWSFVSTLILTLFALTARAEPAAHVEFVTGNVSISDRSNHTRPAQKGMALEQSETVMTNDGRAQIRFTDGGYFSLQPQTHFRIDEYRYSGSHDDADHVFLSLLKGGLRTISGLVGKRNRAAYRMTTPVATIGIRGTEYVLDLQSALYGHVAQGAIEVCNGAGCLIVPGGQAFFVSSPSTLPVFTEKRSVLSPALRCGLLWSYLLFDTRAESFAVCEIAARNGRLAATIHGHDCVRHQCHGVCNLSAKFESIYRSAASAAPTMLDDW